MHPARPTYSKPTDLVPFLTTLLAPRRCDPKLLSAALERVHEAGLRRGFVLVAPTLAERDEAWWSALCRRIRTELRIGVVVVGRRGVERFASEEQRRPGKRCVAVVTDLGPEERAALVELAKSVCTGARGLLAEATAAGTPAFEPARIDGAIRNGALRELLTGLCEQARAASAA